MNRLIKSLIKILPVKTAFAHCDIPCGIYDPHIAQLAAKTVFKMVQTLKELPDNCELITVNRTYALMYQILVKFTTKGTS